jgi:DNA (cytosine-5)-methyltransferase 1
MPKRKSKEIYTPKCVDLFSGCGGLSLGMQNAGFEILAGFDNNKV